MPGRNAGNFSAYLCELEKLLFSVTPAKAGAQNSFSKSGSATDLFYR
jgi:hypothetical protein